MLGQEGDSDPAMLASCQATEPEHDCTEEGQRGGEDSGRLSWSCDGCTCRFSEEYQLRQHFLENLAICGAVAWQAAVCSVASLPGAGTSLWCPACPDDFVGRWTGSATKAAALLRHCSAASRDTGPYRAPHLWFSRQLVDVMLADPPPHGCLADQSPEHGVEKWLGSSDLVAVVGPMLSTPGQGKRLAIQRALRDSRAGQNRGYADVWADRDTELEECKSHSGPPFPFEGCASRRAEQCSVGPHAASPSSPGQLPDVAAGDEAETPAINTQSHQAYDLYDENIPIDVFMHCQDSTVRTADGVPLVDLLSEDEGG